MDRLTLVDLLPPEIAIRACNKPRWYPYRGKPKGGEGAKAVLAFRILIPMVWQVSFRRGHAFARLCLKGKREGHRLLISFNRSRYSRRLSGGVRDASCLGSSDFKYSGVRYLLCARASLRISFKSCSRLPMFISMLFDFGFLR